MLSNMIDTIKQAAIAAVETTKPVAVMPGLVIAVNPLCVSVEQRMNLSTEFMILTETARIRGLTVGDTVMLLRIQGGQKFVVIDRM